VKRLFGLLCVILNVSRESGPWSRDNWLWLVPDMIHQRGRYRGARRPRASPRPFWTNNTWDQYLLDKVGNVTVEYIHVTDGLTPRLYNINPHAEHHDVASDIDRIAEMSVKGYSAGQKVTLHRSWWHNGAITFLPGQESYTVAEEISLAEARDSLTLVFNGIKWIQEGLEVPKGEVLLAMSFEDNLNDDSPYNHGASWQKGESFASGFNGQGIELEPLGRQDSNGISLDREQVFAFAGLSNLHISVKANKNNDDKVYEIFRFHVVYDLSLQPGNKVVFRVWDQDGQVSVFKGQSPVPVGQWGHYEVDWDGSTMRLLVNGAEVLSESWQRQNIRERSSYNAPVIGRNPWGNAFDGKIDELIISTGGADVPEPETYTLGFSADNGTILVSPEQEVYAQGSEVTLTAQPAPGFHFKNWSGDLSGSSNPLTITMDGNKTINAVMEKDAPEPGGEVILDMSFDGHINDDSSANLSATWHGDLNYTSGIGQALSLSPEANNYLTLEKAEVLRGMEAIHLSVRAKKASAEAGMLIHSHVAYKLELANGKVKGYLSSGTRGGILRFSIVDPVPVGQWGQYEVIWDGSSMQVLVNGQLVFEEPFNAYHLDERMWWALHIGKDPWGAAFDGAIDELEIVIPY